MSTTAFLAVFDSQDLSLFIFSDISINLISHYHLFILTLNSLYFDIYENVIVIL